MNRTTKKHINTNFFKNWSADMAYILGYVAADGNIHKRKDRVNSWCFNITSKDKNHLYKLKKAMNSDHKILLKHNGQGDISYQIIISHIEVCYDLINLGITPRKTLTLKPIFVPEKYFSDFVRGYFDADGSVFIYNVNGTPQLKICFCGASLQFMDKLAKDISRLLNISKKAIYSSKSKKTGRNLYHFNFYIEDGKKLFDFMYGYDPTLFMDRKYKIFKIWESTERRHYIKRKLKPADSSSLSTVGQNG